MHRKLEEFSYTKINYTNWLKMKSRNIVTFVYTPGIPGSAHRKPYDTIPIT